MRKLAAIGLAGALATASVGMTTQSAQAHVPGSFVVGALVAVGVLALLHHHQTPVVTTRAYAAVPVYPVYGSSHAAWCKAHYPNTYNAATNLYKGRDGLWHSCISPYPY
jgi:hypothetical protein